MPQVVRSPYWCWIVVAQEPAAFCCAVVRLWLIVPAAPSHCKPWYGSSAEILNVNRVSSVVLFVPRADAVLRRQCQECTAAPSAWSKSMNWIDTVSAFPIGTSTSLLPPVANVA